MNFRMVKKINCLGFMLVLALLVGVVTAPAGVLNADATGGNTYEGKVDYVKDGDTLRTQRPLMQGGIDEVRTLYIDAPETFEVDGHDPGNQIDPHGLAARDYLRQLLPRGTAIIVVTGEQELDAFDRILGQVYRKADGLDINLEMVRKGFNEHYFIGNPEDALFETYRNAQIAAMNSGLGIWSSANPLQEHPFEYRLRMFGDEPKRWVANYSTGKYVDPVDYPLVPAEERIHFDTEQEAINTGYTK